jgi:bile acid-coenzyme A ligase
MTPPDTVDHDTAGTDGDTVQHAVRRAWADALDHPANRDIAADTNFFVDGGDSMTAVALHALLEERLQRPVRAEQVFDTLADGTFADLTALARDAVRAGTASGRIRIGERISALAAEHPGRTAVIDVRPNGTENAVSWEDLARLSNAAAHVLAAAGVDEDGTVVVSLPNGIEHIVATHAAWRLGALVVAVNPALSERELAGLLAKVPDALVVGGPHGRISAEELLAGPDRGPLLPRGVPRSAALTGGSTGASRLVGRRRAWTYDPQDVTPVGYELEGFRPRQVQIAVLPMWHGGFLEPHNGLAMGHTVVVMQRFAPTLFLQLVQKHRVNFTVLVPTLMRTIAAVKDADRYDLSSIEAVYHGSGRCQEPVKRRWLQLLAPERLFEDYGSIEDIGCLTIRGDDWLKHPGSVGRSGPGVAVRVLDDDGTEVPAGTVGQVYLWAAHAGQPVYVGDGPPLAECDGFLSVGDLGYLDDDGYLYLVERRADVINVGGLNVYPAEIEDVLLELDGVADAAVVGRPHDLLGQGVHAFVVLHGGAALGREDLEAHCRQRLVRSKMPVTYEFVPGLPRDAAGKLRRRDL